MGIVCFSMMLHSFLELLCLKLRETWLELRENFYEPLGKIGEIDVIVKCMVHRTRLNRLVRPENW